MRFLIFDSNRQLNEKNMIGHIPIFDLYLILKVIFE